jgi:hypothetical protein
MPALKNLVQKYRWKPAGHFQVTLANGTSLNMAPAQLAGWLQKKKCEVPADILDHACAQASSESEKDAREADLKRRLENEEMRLSSSVIGLSEPEKKSALRRSLEAKKPELDPPRQSRIEPVKGSPKKKRVVRRRRRSPKKEVREPQEEEVEEAEEKPEPPAVAPREPNVESSDVEEA